MIRQIRLKVPLLIMDPKKLHMQLLAAEALMGCVAVADGDTIGGYWRIYSFTRHSYPVPPACV